MTPNSRDAFKASVTADIEKHAAELDGGKTRGIHQRVASALLLESIPMQSNSGLDVSDLTLAVLRPDEAGPEPKEALERLVGCCWHTYPMPGGRGWQFRYEPNILKQIEERMSQIPLEDAKGRVSAEVHEYFRGSVFRLVAWPSSARQVPESADLQLVLCEDERIAKAVVAYSDDADPKAPIPRGFKNAVVAVTATQTSLNSAVDRAQRLLAAEAIEREHKAGEAGKLVREQLQRLKPDLHKHFRLQACRAFDQIVLDGGFIGHMDEAYQVPDAQVMERAQGQTCLKRFLEAKALVYQPGDTLDTHRFLKEVLPGAVPQPGVPDVYSAKAVHERFLAAPGLRLVPNHDIVRQTLLKALNDGKIAIRLADGRAYDNKGCVEGAEGQRRRVASPLTSLALDDTVLVTPVSSATAAQWLKEDKETPKDRGKGTPPPPPPPPPGRVTARSWGDVQKYGAERPLVNLRLQCKKPADSAVLMQLAQPLGADALSLDVTVEGTLKDGGDIRFSATNLKPNHPTKPLQVAQTIFNAVGESASYDAALNLDFGPAGRAGLEAQLRALAQDAPEAIQPQATFEKPGGAS